MKKLFASCLFFAGMLLFPTLWAQGPREVTPEINKKITAEVELQADRRKALWEKDKDRSKEWVAFAVDTFKIELYERRYLEYDYSTAGMNDIAHESADKYDRLMNKYYKKLMVKLAKDDKEALVQAQRAWMTFRDKELQLESTLEAEQYSGGGTAQIVRHASFFEEFVKRRTIEIFEYYESVGNF